MAKALSVRGFALYDKFMDTRGSEIRVQESSWDKEEAVWLFCKRRNQDDSPHLNVDQAKKLIKALQEFVNDHSD